MSVTTANFTKDPSDVLDYSFNWSSWLGSDTITSFTATATPGIVIASSDFTTTVSTVFLSGGTAGTGVPYQVTHQIVTTAGRTKNKTMTIRVADQ